MNIQAIESRLLALGWRKHPNGWYERNDNRTTGFMS